MKKAATLVAGLLLVTGTVFAETGFKLTAKGGVKYENTVFETDKAILQHNQDAGDYDGQVFEANLELGFTEKDTLTISVVDNEDDADPNDLKFEFKHDGEFTDLTIDTDNAFKETNFTLKNTHSNGRVTAQVKGTITSDMYGSNHYVKSTIGEYKKDGDDYVKLTTDEKTVGHADFVALTDRYTVDYYVAPTGNTEFALDDGDDAIYLEYKATEDVKVTFYPYATLFAVDTVFTDDAVADEIEGAAKNYEELKSAAGIKVEGYGATVKVGTGVQNTDETTYMLDLKYEKEVVKNVTVTAEAAFNTADAPTDNDGNAGFASALAAKVVAKDIAGMTLKAEFLNTADKDDTVFTGIYGEVVYKLDTLTVTGKVASKTIGDADAVLAAFVEAQYGLAEMNGLKPTVKASYKDTDLDKDGQTLEASVEAKVERDNLTITPSIELEKETDKDAVTTVKVAVAYTF